MEQYPISQIVVGERIRSAYSADIQELVRSIETEGQLQPIILRKLGPKQARLVAGLHRLEAMKLLDRGTIGVTWLPLTGDDELDDLNEGIAECDENMKRIELGGIRPLFTERRATLTAQRLVLKAKRDAEKAEAEAKAAKAKAKSDADKAEAERLRRAAAEARRKATKTSEKLGASGTELAHACAKTVPKLPSGALDEVRKETGLTRRSIKHDLAQVRAFGREVLTIADRIKLGKDKASSAAEMSALKKLKDQFPDAYESVITSWRRALAEKMLYAKRPSSVLREELARKLAEENKLAGVLPKIKELASTASEIKRQVIDLRQTMVALKGINWKSAPADLRAMTSHLDRLATFLHAVHDAEKLKIEGIR